MSYVKSIETCPVCFFGVGKPGCSVCSCGECRMHCGECRTCACLLIEIGEECVHYANAEDVCNFCNEHLGTTCNGNWHICDRSRCDEAYKLYKEAHK